MVRPRNRPPWAENTQKGSAHIPHITETHTDIPGRGSSGKASPWRVCWFYSKQQRFQHRVVPIVCFRSGVSNLCRWVIYQNKTGIFALISGIRQHHSSCPQVDHSHFLSYNILLLVLLLKHCLTRLCITINANEKPYYILLLLSKENWKVIHELIKKHSCKLDRHRPKILKTWLDPMNKQLVQSVMSRALVRRSV